MRLILALTLVDDAVTIFWHILVSPLDNILFGDFCCTVQLSCNALPLQAVDKCRLHLVGTSEVALQLCHFATTIVCDDRFQKVGVELSLAHLINLGKQQIAHLFECLSLLWLAFKYYYTGISKMDYTTCCIENFLLLQEVGVEQTAISAIREYRREKRTNERTFASRTLNRPSDSDALTLQTEHLSLFDLCQMGRLVLLNLWKDLVRLQLTEILVDNHNRLVWVEISRHTYCHIVWHIVGLIVVLDIGNRRIFQVLLLTDSGLCAVRVVRENSGEKIIKNLFAVACKSHIVLLIDGFQLGVEATNYSICKSLRLNLCPILNLI